MKKAMLMLMMLVVLCGCTETQKQWAKGDLPAGFIENFGDSNLARLTYALVQKHDRNTKVLNEAAKRILIIESDPNDLVARVEQLESCSPCPKEVAKKESTSNPAIRAEVAK